MKKILSIVCAACLMLGTSSNVFATEISSDGTASTTITYTTPSQFCVYIPETLDLTTGSYSFTASMMDIAENEQVVISITNLNEENRLQLSSGNFGTGSAVIWDNERDMALQNWEPVAVFLPGSLETTKSISLNDVQTSGAGTYSGIAQFSISLQS